MQLQLVKSGDKFTSLGGAMALPSGPATSLGAVSPHPLAMLIELEGEFRRCRDLDALRFAVINGAANLFDAVAALLVEPREKTWKVRAAANISKIERHAKRIKQIEAWAGTIGGDDKPRDAIFSDLLDISPGARGGDTARHALWLPVVDSDGQVLAGCILLRDEPWPADNKILAGPMLGSAAYVWRNLKGRAPRTSHMVARTVALRAVRYGFAALLLAAAFIPVPLTVLAPAQVVAADPAILTAPIDGTVEKFHVAAGSDVAAGDVILTFENSRQRNAVAVARKNVDVARARYTKAAQVALVTQDDRHAVAVSRSELQVAQAELAFAREEFAKTVLKAPQPGTLIYTERTDWAGKPVARGDSLFEIGSADNVELQIDINVSDASVQQIGNDIALFLDSEPLQSIPGALERVSYRPQQVDQNAMAYRTYAQLNSEKSLKIGETGVARVSGPTVALWYYLTRRPLTYVRQRFGW